MNKSNLESMRKYNSELMFTNIGTTKKRLYAFADRLTAKPSKASYLAFMTPKEIRKAILKIVK